MSPFASVYGCVLVTTSAVRQTLRGPGTTGWMTMRKIWSRFDFTI